MSKKAFFVLLFSFIAMFLFFYFAFNIDDGNDRKSKKLSSKDLSNLLAGGAAEGDSDSQKIGRAYDKSIFDSDFYRSGKMEGGSDENDPAQGKGELPINPQTGQPYTEEVMEQFDELRKNFPKNDLIPKRLTADQKAEKEKQMNDLNQASNAMMNNTATSEQIKIFYESQEKSMNDRMEIIEYLISNQEEEDTDGQFKKIMEGTKAQLDDIKAKKEEAFRKAGI